MSLADLPVVNASLNGLSAIFLGAGYYFIRRKNQTAHRNCMVSAFVTSTLFLVCYITYHTYVAYVLHRGPTVFKDPAWFWEFEAFGYSADSKFFNSSRTLAARS